MNLIDFITIFILIIASLIGFYRGAIRLIFGLVFFVGALLLTTLFTPLVNEIISDYIYNQFYAIAVSNFLAFIISSIGCTILSIQISRLIRPFADSGLLDKVFGLFLGCMNGMILCLILCFVLAFVSTKSYINSYNHEDIKLKMDKNVPLWLGNSHLFSISRSLIIDFTDLIPKEILQDILKRINSNNKDQENKNKKQDELISGNK